MTKIHHLSASLRLILDEALNHFTDIHPVIILFGIIFINQFIKKIPGSDVVEVQLRAFDHQLGLFEINISPVGFQRHQPAFFDLIYVFP